MKNIEVVWNGSTGYDGYGSVSRAIVRELTRQDVKVHLESSWSQDYFQMDLKERALLDALQDNKVETKVRVIARDPTHLNLFHRPNYYEIAFTYMDTPILSDHDKRGLKLVDEVWAPSRFCEEIFKQYHKNVRYMPQGVNTAIHSPTIRLKTERPFTFLTICSMARRKNLDLVLRAYAQAFTKNTPVKLIVRAYDIDNPNPWYLKRVLNREFGWKAPNHAQIEFHTELNENIIDLYAQADAFVLFSKGEGFCNTTSEAAACGIPVITTKHSGPLTYLNETNSFLVPCEVKDGWGEVELKDAVKALCLVFENQDEAKAIGGYAAEDMKAFDWSITCGMMVKRIGELNEIVDRGV